SAGQAAGGAVATAGHGASGAAGDATGEAGRGGSGRAGSSGAPGGSSGSSGTGAAEGGAPGSAGANSGTADGYGPCSTPSDCLVPNSTCSPKYGCRPPCDNSSNSCHVPDRSTALADCVMGRSEEHTS